MGLKERGVFMLNILKLIIRGRDVGVNIRRPFVPQGGTNTPGIVGCNPVGRHTRIGASIKIGFWILSALFVIAGFISCRGGGANGILPGRAKWEKIAAGRMLSVAIKSDGTLWTWGNNGTTPAQVGSDNNWQSVSCKGFYVVALKTDGTMYAWGENTYGELGLGDNTNRSSPVQIGTDNHWQLVSCGLEHTMALKTDGTLWAWGENSGGNLGLGDADKHSSPAQVGTDNHWKSVSGGASLTVALKTDGTIWGWGRSANYLLGITDTNNSQLTMPAQIGKDTNWKSVFCGYDYCIALKTDGTLWALGDWPWEDTYHSTSGPIYENYGFPPLQVGKDNHWQSVSCAWEDIVALKTDGTLWAWGTNSGGRLGVSVQVSHSFAQVGKENHWQAVACGDGHTLALKSDGTLWAWGQNDSGQLGLGEINDRYSPVRVSANPPAVDHWQSAFAGRYQSMGIKADGTLWAWGYNYSYLPGQIGADNHWKSISWGSFFFSNIIGHNAGIKTDGTLWCWGANEWGQLGLGDEIDRLTPTQLDKNIHWQSVACGSGHTVAIKDDGTLWSFGNNWRGQLGWGFYYNIGDKVDYSSPVQIGKDNNWKSAFCGDAYTIGLKTDGTIWAWGENQYGQLGLLSTINCPMPFQIGTDNRWQSVSCGWYHTVALKSNGTLWAWGYNSTGQLGLGDTENRLSPVQVGADTDWQAVACGGLHTVALKTNGTLWAWGCNSNGQLGLGDTAKRTTPVQIGTDNHWKSVSCGGDHTMAIKTDDSLWVWGWNLQGQLGFTTNRYIPTQIEQ